MIIFVRIELICYIGLSLQFACILVVESIFRLLVHRPILLLEAN